MAIFYYIVLVLCFWKNENDRKTKEFEKRKLNAWMQFLFGAEFDKVAKKADKLSVVIN